MKQALSLSVFITLCLAVPYSIAWEPPAFQPTDHGVGFGLSYDYGYVCLSSCYIGCPSTYCYSFRTCSIWFENGTSVDVAKIEGSSQYKSTMRNLDPVDDSIQFEIGDLLPWYLLPRHLKQYLPLPPRLRKLFDRWNKPSPEVKAIEGMLRALTTAAESYLGIPVPVADTVVPMSISVPSKGRNLLEAATSAVGLERALGFPQAGSLAAMANDVGPYYQDNTRCIERGEPLKLVLTVDYSRASLDAVLYWEEDCIFELDREIHDVNLGASAMERCMHSTEDERCYYRLVEALAQLTNKPINPNRPSLASRVDALVLLGEKGTDPHLRLALRHVLANQIILPGVGAADPGEKDIVDPTFAAARGIAAASWGNQNNL